MIGCNVPITSLPLPVDDPTRRRPDISKAIERLGWKPSVTLDEGLERTIAHFKARPRRTPLE
jgi:UDP-glucuronate decarboxylase